VATNSTLFLRMHKNRYAPPEYRFSVGDTIISVCSSYTFRGFVVERSWGKYTISHKLPDKRITFSEMDEKNVSICRMVLIEKIRNDEKHIKNG